MKLFPRNQTAMFDKQAPLPTDGNERRRLLREWVRALKDSAADTACGNSGKAQ